MYGDCTKGQVKLETIQWLPSLKGGSLRVTATNGVADHLRAVSRDLEALPAKFQVYLKPSAGTYNCRAIAGTTRMSMHAYAAAIDINVKYTDYWRWGGARRRDGQGCLQEPHSPGDRLRLRKARLHLGREMVYTTTPCTLNIVLKS